MEADPSNEKDGWLKARLKKHGIEVVVPQRPEDRSRCYDIIVQELSFGIMNDESRKFYCNLANKSLCEQQGAEAILLGCTEIELLLSRESMNDADIQVPILRSAEIHIECAARAQLGLLNIADIQPPSPL